MGIEITTTQKHHYNYYLAIERDLEKLARFIEFTDDNMTTYSIELAHILLSASSEVDTVIKQLCKILDPNAKAANINHYRQILKNHLPSFIDEEVFIPRYGLILRPWSNWNGKEHPHWWDGYNMVKHQRHVHFNLANLKNTLNAVAALLITVVYYYKNSFELESTEKFAFRDVTSHLVATQGFLSLADHYYYSVRIC